jgi:hypothetical protein
LPGGKLVGNIHIIHFSKTLAGLKIINGTGVTGQKFYAVHFVACQRLYQIDVSTELGV